MRTPGHAVVNMLVFAPHAAALPVIVGAVLPDVPIAALYLWERRVRGTPEEKIWSGPYQQPFWQRLIHGAHSFPLTGGAALLAHLAGAPGLAALFASMFVHALADLPIHAEDAHRHFMPLSDWRFVSPLSYWDVRHHARVVAALEALLVVVCALVLALRVGAVGRAALGAVSAWYVHGYWRTFLRGDGRWQPYF